MLFLAAFLLARGNANAGVFLFLAVVCAGVAIAVAFARGLGRFNGTILAGRGRVDRNLLVGGLLLVGLLTPWSVPVASLHWPQTFGWQSPVALAIIGALIVMRIGPMRRYAVPAVVAPRSSRWRWAWPSGWPPCWTPSRNCGWSRTQTLVTQPRRHCRALPTRPDELVNKPLIASQRPCPKRLTPRRSATAVAPSLTGGCASALASPAVSPSRRCSTPAPPDQAARVPRRRPAPPSSALCFSTRSAMTQPCCRHWRTSSALFTTTRSSSRSRPRTTASSTRASSRPG